ncbi:MAG: gliding motility-associated C-terminal domain-containing protein, partial [Saprospiraceae bacterium]|nr:gliding motility-associated C-terminal domain-containing protein [Saprospiraceae bacterium]
GIYLDTLTTSSGCDSIITLLLTVNEFLTTEVNASICQGETYLFNGIYYDSTGIYLDTLSTSSGCDSFITLLLTVNEFLTTEVNASICQGETYLFNGIYYDSTGTYLDTLTTSSGCDSIITLLLTVDEFLTTEVNASICQGETYLFNGIDYDSIGTYIDTLTSVQGCDSIIILNLTLVEAPDVNILGDSILCIGDSILLSIDTTYSLINWSTGSNESSITITSGGNYSVTITDTNGCQNADSLFIITSPLPIVYAGADTILDCVINEVTIGPPTQLPGNYMWTGPGINISNETQINPTVNIPGQYLLEFSDIFGCSNKDSIIVEYLNNAPVADAGPPQILTCTNDTITLYGSSSASSIIFHWAGPGIDSANQNNENPIIALPGIYTLYVIDTLLGCSSSVDTVLVDENMLSPIAEIVSSGALSCISNRVILDGTGSTSGGNIIYSWQDSAGTALGNGVTLEVSVAGYYTLLVMDTINGCFSIDSSLVLDQTSFPSAQAGNPVILNCKYPNASLDGTKSDSSSIITILWTGPENGILFGDSSLTPIIKLPGMYTITVTDMLSGCSQSDSVLVLANFDTPTVNLADSIQLSCKVDSILISPIFATSGPSILYNWTTTSGQIIGGTQNKEAIVNKVGIYYLNLENSESGCTASDSIIILYPDQVEAIINVNSNCIGEANGIIEIASITGGTEPYVLSINNGPLTQKTYYSSLNSGEYNISIQDSKNCTLDTTVTINTFPELTVDLGPDLHITLGDVVQLDAEVNIPFNQLTSIDWTPENGLSCTDCLDPGIQPFYTTLFHITVTDANNCSASDNVLILVNQEVKIYIPNAFSPNRDGINDKFMIYAGPGVARIQEFNIFDRWGNHVFQVEDFPPNDPHYGWDGKFRDEPMNPAVFVYYTVVELINGDTILLKGDVNLVR